MDRRDADAVSAATPIALTIAGSDSGGGAGVQADLKTFAALGVYGASAITALTAQNTLGVSAIHLAPPEIVAAQIEAVFADFDVAAVKIGMLGSAGIVEAVARALLPLRAKVARVSATDEGSAPSGAFAPSALRRDPSSVTPSGRHLPPQGGKESPAFLIYDPVLVASSGHALAGAGFLDAVKARLLPLVDCLTPNLSEAAALLGAPLATDEAEMARQGAALLALGPRAVLMKGGHLEGAEAVDLLVAADGVHRFAAPRLSSPNLHGTGCTLSSAIAAYIVLGLDLVAAVREAKAFVRQAIQAGREVMLGRGAGPLLQARLRPASDASG